MSTRLRVAMRAYGIMTVGAGVGMVAHEGDGRIGIWLCMLAVGGLLVAVTDR